eukprot:COSAG02_NODE_65450_length_258_cov_0.641509_1_plen_53_part_01
MSRVGRDDAFDHASRKMVPPALDPWAGRAISTNNNARSMRLSFGVGVASTRSR